MKTLEERIASHARLFNNQAPAVTEALSLQLVGFFNIDSHRTHIKSAIVQNPTINAYATIKRSATTNDSTAGGATSYFVGIQTGLMATVCKFVAEITHEPEARAEIFDKDFSLTVGYLDTFTSQVILAVYSLVMMHEFSHIMLGHLEWISTNMGMDALSEVASGDAMDPITSQALEFQADAFSMGPAFRLGALNPGYAGFGCMVLFYLISHANESISGRRNSTHPHPICRWANWTYWLRATDIYTEQEKAQWVSGYAGARLCMRKSRVRDLFDDLPPGSSDDQVLSSLADEVEPIHRRAIEIFYELKPVHNLPWRLQ